MSETVPYYTHPNAIVETVSVGARTRIWAFAHVLPRARIGEDCNICDHTFVENDVWIGNRVTIKSGVQVWDGVTLEDDVFVGPNATFTNDPFPRSRHVPDAFPRTVIRSGASIGANATILPGIEVGAKAMIGAGAVVTKDVPAGAIVFGNPARIRGYVSDSGASAATTNLLRVHGAEMVNMKGPLPFASQNVRVAPDDQGAVHHARRQAHRVLMCVSGSCSVLLDDGAVRDEIQLASADIGVHVPPLVWVTELHRSPGAVLLTLASVADDADCIRDYDEFVRARGARR